MLALRPIVLLRQKPRPLFVQPVLKQQNGTVKLLEYDSNPAGLISSFLDRFDNEDIKPLKELAQRDNHFFCLNFFVFVFVNKNIQTVHIKLYSLYKFIAQYCLLAYCWFLYVGNMKVCQSDWV